MFNIKPLIITGMTAVALSSIFAATTSSAKPPVNVTYASETASATQTVLSGTFEGRSDHVTSGKVSLEKTENGYELVFADSFFLDGAPDPIVGFGNKGAFEISSKLGKLAKRTGAQSYQLPESFTPEQYSEVHVYCEKFSVPLGIATLN